MTELDKRHMDRIIAKSRDMRAVPVNKRPNRREVDLEIERNTANASWLDLFRCNLFGQRTHTVWSEHRGEKEHYIYEWKGKSYRVNSRYWALDLMLWGGLAIAYGLALVVMIALE